LKLKIFLFIFQGFLHQKSVTNVTLHRTLMLKVIACSQHASTLKQRNLVLAHLKCVQEHTSLTKSFVSWCTLKTIKRDHLNNLCSVSSQTKKRVNLRKQYVACEMTQYTRPKRTLSLQDCTQNLSSLYCMKRVKFRYRLSMKYLKYCQTFDWFFTAYAWQFTEISATIRQVKWKFANPIKKSRKQIFEQANYRRTLRQTKWYIHQLSHSKINAR